MNSTARCIRKDDLDLILQIPEVAGVCRDEGLRLVWCTPLFYRWGERVSGNSDLMGRTLGETLKAEAAQEREHIQYRVMRTGVIEHHYQLSNDRRVLCSIFPLDAESFGHQGIFALIKESPHNIQMPNIVDIPVISTPNLNLLDSLSLRELEVLHHVAKGRSTKGIASQLCRASKTIEHHINAIHSRLGTTSRAQLVRWASERGIQSFTDDEWCLIIEGTRRLRKQPVRS